MEKTYVVSVIILFQFAVMHNIKFHIWYYVPPEHK